MKVKITSVSNPENSKILTINRQGNLTDDELQRLIIEVAEREDRERLRLEIQR